MKCVLWGVWILGGGCKGVGEGEKGGREEVESDQSLPPKPAVITMCLYVCPSLGVVVKVTQLYRSEISKNVHLFPHPLHEWCYELRET